MIKYIDAKQAKDLISSGNTCILNIVAAWCSDCTKQAANFAPFANCFTQQGFAVYELNVQDDKHVFLSPQHQQLTEQFGGHGFPRTALLSKGKIVDADNIEVISAEQLSTLAEKFQKQLDAD